ncbi:hypothetical protein [Micromonospora sp. NPDC049282]|uniref:hypothetical protein n=1 Tax=Micromonospora sp. NPDC049282 TaxID=3364269 RepID=UPI00371FE604
MTAPYRPGPPPGARPGPPPGIRPAPVEEVGEASHPAVDAAVRGMANAEALAPADQIAQYEAAYETLRETLATIDQA